MLGRGILTKIFKLLKYKIGKINHVVVDRTSLLKQM